MPCFGSLDKARGDAQREQAARLDVAELVGLPVTDLPVDLLLSLLTCPQARKVLLTCFVIVLLLRRSCS